MTSKLPLALVVACALAAPLSAKPAGPPAAPVDVPALRTTWTPAELTALCEQAEKDTDAKLKQLVRWYRAGGIFADAEDERTRLLRCADLSEIRAWFRARQGSA